MSAPFPGAVDLRLTGRCNMRCPYCFGPDAPALPDSSVLLSFFAQAKRAGCRHVVITGGEPTCDPRFRDIVQALRKMGYTLALSTNGTCWRDPDLWSFITRQFDWVSLPLDAADPALHNRLRPGAGDHHALIMEIFRSLDPERGFRLKLGTVVCRLNIDQLPDIAASLPVTPDLWKLFQLCPSRRDPDFTAANRVDTRAFLKQVARLKAACPTDLRIHASTSAGRDGAYLFVDPDGALRTIRAGRERALGSIGQDFETISAACAALDAEKVLHNYQMSFPSD